MSLAAAAEDPDILKGCGLCGEVWCYTGVKS